MNRRPLALVGLAALALAAIALVAADAEARPGGGQGYSGGGGRSSGGGYRGGGGSYSGGSSSSGGGDDGVGMLIYLLIRLVFEVPVIGVPLVVIGGIFLYMRVRNGSDIQSDRWASSGDINLTFEAPAPARRPGLERVRARDPEFSVVLFEDFMYALYARVHTARSSVAMMASLAPYVAENTRATLLARDPAGVPISGVVVGAMQVLAVKIPDDPAGNIRVDIKFEANYTATVDGRAQGYYLDERWSVERVASVVSKPPGEALEFRCPNCGAPFESTGGERCRYCQQDVGQGRFDWTLTHVRLLRQETRPPALTAEVAERGTDAPTVFEPRVQAQHAALVAEDPGAAPELIERRLRAIYSELNIAWTALDLRRIRPLVSDALFNYLEYWIGAYRQQGLRNVLEEMAISRVQIVKLTRDRHYDAITVRFWASGRDYTVRAADNKAVSGSKIRKRVYSEYWTLIRGAKVRGAPREPGNCPSCGAATDRVNMAGTCEYCGSHLTRGEFDWVLSKIEQDDSYAG